MSDHTPDTPEALEAEIERTRAELGETVEALAAKADVKARAQHRAAELTESLRGKAREAKEKVAGQTGQLRSQVATRADGAGGAVRRATPQPVQESAKLALSSVRAHRGMAAAAASTLAAVLVWLAARKRRG